VKGKVAGKGKVAKGKVIGGKSAAAKGASAKATKGKGNNSSGGCGILSADDAATLLSEATTRAHVTSIVSDLTAVYDTITRVCAVATTTSSTSVHQHLMSTLLPAVLSPLRINAFGITNHKDDDNATAASKA
jgi:hypothetical protein